MNPRAKRKPVVIRVSLGARETHITLGLYRRAPLVSIIFLLLRRGGQGDELLFRAAILLLRPPFPSSPSPAPCPCLPVSSSPLPPPLPYASLLRALRAPRVGVRDAPEKLHVQTTMTLLSSFLPPLTLRRRAASAESVIFPATFRQWLHDASQLPRQPGPRQNFRTLTCMRLFATTCLFQSEVTLTCSLYLIE